MITIRIKVTSHHTIKVIIPLDAHLVGILQAIKQIQIIMLEKAFIILIAIN